MSISLVITTYNRYDTFLKNNLLKYLENPYIKEIIIYDDCSDDYNKIKYEFINFIHNNKIKLYQQKQNIGALRNKIMALQMANEEWICLMDSDNYCGISYFEALEKYWNIYGSKPSTIYVPEKALPNFIYTDCTTAINRDTWNNLLKNTNYDTLLNTGNYVLHRSLVPFLTPVFHDTNIKGFTEVKYMNYIFVRDADAIIQVVPNMTYEHVVHNGSFYMQYSDQHSHFNGTFNWII